MIEDIDFDNPAALENFKSKLSEISFEDLQKLKQQVGLKMYNEKILGIESKKNRTDEEKKFKRLNKNRPREMSSKIRVFDTPKLTKNAMIKNTPRDPRFDPLCGTFDEKYFKRDYRFVDDIKKNEREVLADQLKDCDDPKERKKIKFLIQRIDNQFREKEKLEQKKQKDFEEKREIAKKLRSGEKPIYKKKSDKKIINLLDKYEELVTTNRLKKHLEKKSKKIAREDKSKLNM